MKVVDLQYNESIYNNINEIDDIIAHLLYPQKYICLRLGGVLYNLDVVETHKDCFILKVDGKVEDGKK